MLTLTSDQTDALANRQLMRRYFIWCEATNPDTGLPDPAGFWDDVGTVIVDGKTYHGSGSIFSISNLSAKADYTIPGLTITMSGVSQEVVAMVRGDTLGQAPITVALGLFDPASHAIIGPLIRRFVGAIDDIEIVTPKAGERSQIVLTCESASRALTIKGIGTRSGSTQRQRAPDDAFYDYTASMPQLALYFGRAAP